MRLTALLLGLNLPLAGLVMTARSAEAKVFLSACCLGDWRNCCKTNTQGDGQCCVDCCWGTVDQCTSSDSCPDADQ